MQRSTDRIPTTHCGSPARPRPLLELVRETEHGRPYDRDAVAAAVTDVAPDGELGRASVCGRERVIAGTDSGFSSRASFPREIPGSVVWETLRSLAERTRLADAQVRR